MADGESPSPAMQMQVSHRLDAAGFAGDKGSRAALHSHSFSHPGSSSHAGTVSRDTAFESRSRFADHAGRFAPAPSGADLPPPPRDRGISSGDGRYTTATTTATTTTTATEASSEHRATAEHGHPLQFALSRSNSQATLSSNGPDSNASGGRLSPGTGSVHGSSQDSQLLQLSQIAAAQERIPEDTVDGMPGASRKRMADGMVKHTRDKSYVSPGQTVGHSRNTSTVSMASTAGSRIGELSAELKTRLSYAMVKVNHGWQSHSIDQVEALASQAASPASTASTIHLRNGSSASPQLSTASHQGSNNTTPATVPQHHYSGRPGDSQWRDSPQSTSRGSSASPVKSLAPPVSIQPSQHAGNPRREPNPRQVPSFLSSSQHASPRAGLHTSPYLAPDRHHRSALADAMLVSPHTNVREQDAIESLLFMSSPGNSANLKHAFPSSSSQPLPSNHAPAAPQQRTALPSSQPRKSLPSGRPPHHARAHSHSHTHSQPTKRVGFEKSPSAMDIDDPSPFGSPMSVVSRGTPRRSRTAANGGGGGGAESHPNHTHQRHQQQQQQQHIHPTASSPQTSQLPPRPMKQLPVSAGLTVASKPRRPLADADIDAMLERAAAAVDEDSDSDGEICIPVRVPRARREGADADAGAGAGGGPGPGPGTDVGAGVVGV
ncbi:8a324262-806a-45a3-8048-a9d99362e25b [Thermothielavioides terrestris]|uniref:8a324262-806a-45a3-8048-a9d99362e25b n=1 Tax=Thermothielavioides terrestris TaxID=2587410 RepID=A0A446BNF4_9PEZI|nr:8a324262-806a-45a3-8048-a9d99362e25b [Thermothielavioides terrestris]